MSIQQNIKNTWDKECLDRTKDDILVAIARDNRLPRNTALSVREKYFYKLDITDEEAPIVLEIMHNALRLQNERTNELINQ